MTGIHGLDLWCLVTKSYGFLQAAANLQFLLSLFLCVILIEVTTLKKLINEKITAHQYCTENGKSEQSFHVFQAIQNLLLSATEVSKHQYYPRISKKMMHSRTNPKTYTLKIPCTPSLFRINKFILNFRNKTELFSNFLLNSVL